MTPALVTTPVVAVTRFQPVTRALLSTDDGSARILPWIGRDTGPVILSRGWSVFLVAVGVFNWAIWPRFSVAIWDDPRAWSGAVGLSSPTSFLLVHGVLVITAVTVGTIVGVLGVRAFLADRRVRAERSRALVDAAG